MDSNEDSFLEQYYSKELQQAAVVAASKKHNTEPDFFELDEQRYQQGVPFKIDVPEKSFSYINYVTPDESSTAKIEASKHYSDESFESATITAKKSTPQEVTPNAKRTLERDSEKPAQQPQESLHSIEEQNAHTDVAVKEEYQNYHDPARVLAKDPKLTKSPQQERRGNIQKSPSKPARRPYTKVPFHGLFLKRHIRNSSQSPSSDLQERPCELTNKYSSVSKLFVKQIVEMDDSAIESLDEESISKLNEILEERLAKYKEHYKEQLKEKCYIEANELMRRVLVNRKTIAKQRMKIANVQHQLRQVEDLLRRQSADYTQQLHSAIIQLDDIIKKKKISNKQLAAQVQKKEENEKRLEKREHMQEQITEMGWQCVLIHKENINRHKIEAFAAKKVQIVSKKLEDACMRLKDLETTMMAIVEKYYQLNPDKVRQVESTTPTKQSSKPIPEPVTKPYLSQHKLSAGSVRYQSPGAQRRRYSSSTKLARKVFSVDTKILRMHRRIDGRVKEVQSMARINNESPLRPVPDERHTQPIHNFNPTLPIDESSRVETEVQTDIELYEPPAIPYKNGSASSESPDQNTPPENKEQSDGEPLPEKPILNYRAQPVREHVEGPLPKSFTYTFRKNKVELENPETFPEVEIAPPNNITPKMLVISRRRFQKLSIEPSEQPTNYSPSTGVDDKPNPTVKYEQERPKHRIRKLNYSEIESIAEVDEPDQLSSIKQTLEIGKYNETASAIQLPVRHEPLQRFKRKFQLRSGTDTDEVGELEQIPLRGRQPSVNRPDWLTTDQPQFS